MKMATYNNKHWLLCHIRDSFVSTDDTGMCELVMLGEDFPRQMHAKHTAKAGTSDTTDYYCYPGLDHSDEEEADILSQSYDIQLDMAFGGHRYRSNTAQRLEKMDQARRKAAKIKTIKWENTPVQLTDDEKAELFEKKDLTAIRNENKKNKKSLLTERLLKSPLLPENKYIEYARFDGTAQVGVSTRRFQIFLTMLSDEFRNYPMPVVVLANATIRELIGLICYKCSIVNPSVLLKPVTQYGLYITEDDGELDDFPCIEPKEPCSKFGFTHLGLVEHAHDEIETPVEPPETPDISKQPITLPATEITHFEASARMQGYTSVIEAPLYQSYRLQILTKVRAKTEVNLGISGEKIEIDPVQQKNNKFWARQKAVSYNMDSIAWCELVENKHTRATFRLFYSLSHNTGHSSYLDASPGQLQTSASFKHHDFETDINTAEEIIAKINNILEVRSSVSRNEYIASKERKSQTRRSFNLSSSFK